MPRDQKCSLWVSNVHRVHVYKNKKGQKGRKLLNNIVQFINFQFANYVLTVTNLMLFINIPWKVRENVHCG